MSPVFKKFISSNCWAVNVQRLPQHYNFHLLLLLYFLAFLPSVKALATPEKKKTKKNCSKLKSVVLYRTEIDLLFATELYCF